MLHELLTRLPTDAGTRGLTLALSLAATGLLLWIAGARFSRSFFTLAGVAAGAWLGLRVPRWLEWEIDPMAVSIGAALVLGLAGYLLHMTWVGLMLGGSLATAGVCVAWHRMGDGSIPTVDVNQPVNDALRALWAQLPGGATRVIPMIAGACFVAGGIATFFWPRLARVLAFSLLGSALLAGGGLAAVWLARPQWLDRLPTDAQTQGVALAILVVLGAIVQWILLPRAAKPDDATPGGAKARTSSRHSGGAGNGARPGLGPMNPKEARA